MLYLYLDLFCFVFFVTKKNIMVYMLKSVLLLSVIWLHVKREREKTPKETTNFNNFWLDYIICQLIHFLITKRVETLILVFLLYKNDHSVKWECAIPKLLRWHSSVLACTQDSFDEVCLVSRNNSPSFGSSQLRIARDSWPKEKLPFQACHWEKAFTCELKETTF